MNFKLSIPPRQCRIFWGFPIIISIKLEKALLCAVDALQNNIDKLMRFPRMGEEHPDEYLKVLNFCKLAHDNHIVIYRVDTETVIIERIVWASSNYPELFQQGVPTL